MPVPFSVSVTHTITRPIDTMLSTITTPNYLTGLNAEQVNTSQSKRRVCTPPSSDFARWPKRLGICFILFMDIEVTLL